MSVPLVVKILDTPVHGLPEGHLSRVTGSVEVHFVHDVRKPYPKLRIGEREAPDGAAYSGNFTPVSRSDVLQSLS
jgi:hypothetical protein